MLQNKDTHKVSELKNSFTHSWVEDDFIFRILKCFAFSPLNKALCFFKHQGYGFDLVMSLLITMPFANIQTVNQLAAIIKPQKDVFYRVKNSGIINWRFIFWLFVMKFYKLTENSANAELTKCLIFDDTILKKSGDLIEKVSRVWDHVEKRSVLGFKALVMGFWDGTSFIPLDFSLHREKGKNKKHPFGLSVKNFRGQFRKKRTTGCHGYDRAAETDLDKITSMLKMLKRAVSHKINFDYVLTDSWFTCDQLIDAVCNIKNVRVHLIGMYSKAKSLFIYKDKSLTYSQIRNMLGKPKRCRKLKLFYHQVKVMRNGREIQLFFSKHGSKGKWRVILTTDTSLSFIQAIEIYQTRWTIEVFFKEAKQLLNLGGCQSSNFDAQIADTTITCLQHILLTFRHRFDTYESKGALFKELEDSIINYRLNERLWGLFIQLLNLLTDFFKDYDIDEMDFFTKIISDEAAFLSIRQIFLPDYPPDIAA
jgi:hypothetical protein